MVVEDKIGVVKLFPVASELPPVLELYQLMVPAEATAPSVAVPGLHVDPGVVDVIAGAPTTKLILLVDTAQLGGVPELLVEIFHSNT